MEKLIPILVISLTLAYISHRNSAYVSGQYGEAFYESKDKLFYILMTVSMAAFVGLRTRGNDTFTYGQMYESVKSGWEGIREIDWQNFASAPGLEFVSACLKAIGATTQDYFMVFALITICVYLWFVHKYTSHIWFSVYFFITMGVYTFAMAAIKQTVAVAFLLIATDKAIEKKYAQFIVWVFIAQLFHPYAFVYLIVPFLFFTPWTNKTWTLLLTTTILSFGLSNFMSGILIMTDALGASYSESEFVGEGVNIFRVLVVSVPVLISFLGRKIIWEKDDRVSNLIINLTMINALIMFLGLFGTANYFARLANYFLIFQTLSLPRLFGLFNSQSKSIVKCGSIGCYFAYFYYQMVLANGSFDSGYAFISLMDFIKQLG